jgi:hypothetical protein
MLGVCLAATVALNAVGASGASAKSALPEWGKCEATEGHTGGKYSDAGCTVPVKKVYGKYPGGYEWHALENGESRQSEESGIFYNTHYVQPVPTSTITLASGLTITCHQENGDDRFYLGGGSGGHTVGTPLIEFRECFDNQPGEEKACHTTDASNVEEVWNRTAYADWREQESGAWLGSMVFIEGKNTFEPKVALEWKTEEPRGRFFQQLVCLNGYTIIIGGGARNEALGAQIEPLNQMSGSFTTHLSPTLPAVKGTKPLEAEVNTGTWESIGIEATLTFTEVDPYSGNINHQDKELELKATA